MAQELLEQSAPGREHPPLPMNVFATLRNRISAAPDTEGEQAMFRLVIIAAILAYYIFVVGPQAPHEITVALGVSGFFVIAVGIFVSICVRPFKSVPRRIIGMLSDNAGATFYAWLAGENGLLMIAVYLFVAFGNGARYGSRYLWGSAALSWIGFLSVIFAVPYWHFHRIGGLELFAALVVLPWYVNKFLMKIKRETARAEEANRAKTTFLANMSHEIRTPLNGIVGVVDLFQATTLSVQQSELVRLMRHSVSVLRSLVDDVLDISKIESGRLSIEVAPFDLHATLNGLVHLLRPHAKAKGLALRAAVDPMLDYRLQGDSHHLRQILLNLLGNAIKFTERGEVTLSVEQTKETHEGVTARFEVRDTGIGIPEAALPRIFERFVQADDSTTRRYGGSGLGTTIAKQLVELMGGTIGVRSKVGEGSTFWFELPLLRDLSAVSPVESGTTHNELTLLVGAPDGIAKVAPLVEAGGGRYEVLPSANAVGPKIERMVEAGVSVRAIVVAADVDTACIAFNAAVQRLGEKPVALVHVAQAPLSVVDAARIRSINDACTLGPSVAPRAFTNAVHAATATGGRESAEIINLADVLKQQRVALRVLVAEDNTTNQAIISKLLEHAGHTVILAADGDEALDLYEQQKPDIALLDFNMPQLTGVEVIRAIRVMEPSGERLPAIVLSASVTPEARERAKAAGADEFMGKPFEAAILLQTIDRLARRKSRSPQPIARAQSQGPVVELEMPLVDTRRVTEVESIARDPKFLAELLRGFRDDVAAILDRLDGPVASAKWEAVHDLMHTLKGAALGIGAQQLAMRCVEIDAAVARGQTGQLAELVTDLRRCFDATLVQLNNYTTEKHRLSL